MILSTLAPSLHGARGRSRTNAYSFFRYLFPNIRQRARAKVSAFRHDTVPFYGKRVHSRIFRFLVERQARRQRRKAAGKTILAQLGIGRRNRAFAAIREKHAQRSKTDKMTQPAGMPGFGNQRGTPAGTNDDYTPHERGSRRKKLAGYLKAANELRQSYLGSGQYDGEGGEDFSNIPGSFPELKSAKHGDEEMILFPSYARRHYPRKTSHQDIPGLSEDLRNGQTTGDSEYWRREWEKHEDDTCVVDVDVRGWIYSPHRGPMSRKNKILVGIARRLSGIPAPSTDSRPPSPSGSLHSRLDSHAAKHEEEQIEREAEVITRRGEGEADVAWRGGFSEPSQRDSETESLRTSPSHSRTSSLDRERPSRLPFRSSNGSIRGDDASSIKSLEKTSSWSTQQDMSPAELSVANAHLMSRLKPFLNIPLVNTPLTVFFYNDTSSKSRSLNTNESGYFTIRTPLDFVPTHVRVLASEKLSATEEVKVTEPQGISVISDIDDTIKHSGIGNGAKDIFRNVFVRELHDLTIEGVREWYNSMARKEVQFHYVSNAPWQLYPVLTSFFALAGLPKGTYHLKQYNGMLQGIFEPVAERKKGTLDKIMQDFPERRFILVGDSGEADLELYTDIVLANPGRVLGVFIRDVTTAKAQGFFDSSKPLNKRSSQSPIRGRRTDNGTLSHQNSSPDLSYKPDLPARPPARSSQTSVVEPAKRGPAMGQLIDFEEEPPVASSEPASNPESSSDYLAGIARPPLPEHQPKPDTLRSNSSDVSSMIPSHRPSAPPRNSSRRPLPPPKPRQLSVSEDATQPNGPSPLSQLQNASPPRSNTSSSDRQGYRTAAVSKLASAYNALPAWSSTTSQTQPQQQPASTRSTPADDLNQTQKLPPPIPPRRNLSSYPAAAAHYATNRLSGGWSGYSSESGAGPANGGVAPPISKKEEMWKRRWERAEEIFRGKGVLLRSWRRGEDVMNEAVGLIEKAERRNRAR